MIVLLPLLYHSLQLLSVTWEVEENLCLRLFDSVAVVMQSDDATGRPNNCKVSRLKLFSGN
jgi:hypothetical protein